MYQLPQPLCRSARTALPAEYAPPAAGALTGTIVEDDEGGAQRRLPVPRTTEPTS
jgi:hypothetical protein